MNQIEFVDIVSKPVAITFRRIQTLGIYCWQYEKTERRAAFFLPRLSFNSKKGSFPIRDSSLVSERHPRICG